MLQQAIDFREECDALFDVLEPLSEADFERKTLFKDWTINDVLGHLHMWNHGADLSLNDPEAFAALMKQVSASFGKDQSHLDYMWTWLKGIRGKELLAAWREFYPEMAERFGAADPKARVKWAGPDMSVRSSITARHMETWAHGQEIYDLLGKECPNTDRIKNIAVIGVNTFRWTFLNRGMEVPEDVPYVRLTAPSGAIWEWNEPSETNRIEGSAVEFCAVVTQVRNIADTSLTVDGLTAMTWMAVAQCFAGAPEDPPAPGTRHIAA